MCFDRRALRQIEAFLSLGVLEEYQRVCIHKEDREPPKTVLFYFETPDAYFCKWDGEIAIYSKEAYYLE